MMKHAILQHLAECPWQDTLYWFDTIDSTNTRAKAMAEAGAKEGTVILAGRQTAGRGRLGRSFHSPADAGIYLSVILRPDCTPDKLMHLTCAVAVAMCNAVEQAAGIRPAVKWINDLILQQKKLGGILTELSVDPKSGLVRYAIVGIGINCGHDLQDFPAELQTVATSLKMVTGKCPDTGRLAAAMIQNLWQMRGMLLTDKRRIMDAYRKDCQTIDQAITVIRGDEKRNGKALFVDDDGGLTVAFSDGTVGTVSSGEVSIRGLCGYCQ